MNQLMKLLDLIKALAECYREADKDGKITLTDIVKFEPAMDELVAFIVSVQKGWSANDLDFRAISMIGVKFQEITKILKG